MAGLVAYLLYLSAYQPTRYLLTVCAITAMDLVWRTAVHTRL